MKQAFFYMDVPADLVDVLNKIDYANVTPSQGNEFLKQLDELATKYGLPKRTTQGRVKSHAVQECVPDEAIKAVNSRDYSSIPRIALSLAKPVILNKLKAMGLLR